MEQPELPGWKPAPPKLRKSAGSHEWKIVSVRETAPGEMPLCKEPQAAADYWRAHVTAAPHFNPEVECFVTLMLNAKHRIRGHNLVSIGSLNETVAHPREVFRAAVIASAYAVVLMHNHPSGDPTPSSADIHMTRILVDAGNTLRIAVLDHVIVGSQKHCSLKECGHL